jgi:hypothetical protein
MKDWDDPVFLRSKESQNEEYAGKNSKVLTDNTAERIAKALRVGTGKSALVTKQINWIEIRENLTKRY